MHCTTLRGRGWKRAVLAAASIPTLLAGAFAQTIPNPSFEIDTFTVFPGYISGNAPITGWTTNAPSSAGLNPSAGSPFANNGAVPDGSKVAFIQSNGAKTTLGTTISGLTVGQQYQLWFRANARSGQKPRLTVAIDGTTLMTATVDSVGSANPYRYVAVDFAAGGTTAELELGNETAGDTTVVVDDFRIKTTTNPWSYAPWTDDASTGIDPSFVYTHAYNLGAGTSPTINGIAFNGVGGTNPSVAGKFSTTALTGLFANDVDNAITGTGSPIMANDFVYNGFPTSITLQGLVAGRDYVFSLFSTGWDPPLTRVGTFRSGTDMHSMDQDVFGQNAGVIFNYRYTAPAGGSVVIFTDPIQAASIHMYGFANREAEVVAVPTISSHPLSTYSIIGQSVTLSASASGSRPMSFQWQKNGADIPGATDSQIVLPITSAADAAFYRMKATNTFGTATSNAAFVEVYAALPGAIYNTGLDTSGNLLDDGSLDPHYALVTNPDNAGIPDAFVQDTTAFPIVAGPWLAGDTTSKWIGPRLNTSGAAGPDPTTYVYETTFDLTGQSTAIVLTGSAAVDNDLSSIAINDVPVPGAALSHGFTTLTPFLLRSTSLPAGTVVAGSNRLSFTVVNQGVGYTGLITRDMQVASVPSGVAPIIVTQSKSQSVVSGSTITLSTSVYGSAPLTYQWKKGASTLTGQTGTSLTISPFTVASAGDYTLTATNPAGSSTTQIITLSAVNVPPSIVTPPTITGRVGVGDSLTLSVTADGSSPFSYQWRYNDQDISGQTGSSLTLNSVTRAASGRYSVRVTNAYGNVTSDDATLTVYDVVPGTYNTGVDAAGAALPDGEPDGHYLLVENADGTALVPPVVEDSTVFPIVAGPWVANTAQSKWVGPRLDTVGAGAGDYVYRLNIDLTGFDLSTVSLVGKWATDNVGVAIRVNGNDVGLSNQDQFAVYTDFTLAAPTVSFVDGINTVDFVVNNTSPGYTGLRVDSFRGFGFLASTVPAAVVTVTVAPNGQPTLTWPAVSGVTYSVQRSTSLETGTWTTVGTPTNNNGTMTYTDTNPPLGKAFYRVVSTKL